MKKQKIEFDDLLTLADRAELRSALERLPTPLTLPQAHRLGVHAAALQPAPQSLRLGVVHTYTSDLLDPWLALHAALNGLACETYHAPYGLALQEAEPGSALVAHQPDIMLILLRREDLHPEVALPLTGLPAEQRSAIRQACVAQVADIVGRFRAQPVGQIVLTLLPALTAPTLGLYDAQSDTSDAAFWAALKADVAAWIRTSCPSTLFMDLDDVAAQVGRQHFFDRRYWHSAQFPFTPVACREFTQRLMAVATVMKTPKVKVLVLDADNTLWGGVIGEDGIDGIALGPEYPGSAYKEFQRRILDFQQRGFILAMCSKNNQADVDEVLQRHPHMLLRQEHFAARRVNWISKPDNLISLAEELNLGVDSFIFVDDSDHECAAVRDRLPQVEVIQVPSRPVDVANCLDAVARLEVLSLTAEDLQKTAMYAQERQRREILEQASTSSNSADYLARLGMKMQITLAPSAHVPRLSQLTKKTNQFNLTTRRYEEHELRAFIASDTWLVADFSLADRFGDSGIVGLAMFKRLGSGVAELDTFLMSCRVIGRQAESTFLQALLEILANQGVNEVHADYLQTAKNSLVKNLLPQEGFQPSAERWFIRLDAEWAESRGAFPIEIHLVHGQHPASDPSKGAKSGEVARQAT